MHLNNLGIDNCLLKAVSAAAAAVLFSAAVPISFTAMSCAQEPNAATPLKIPTEFADADIEHFETKVLPLLRERCYDCHSHEAGDASGQLMVDTLASMMSGGTRGPSLVPGNPAASVLYTAMMYDDPELQMPPDGKLSDDEIALFEQWIKSGAAVPAAMVGQATEKNDATASLADSHWSYQPPEPLQVSPEVSEQYPNPIDQAIAVGLADAGLTMSPRASRRTLIRRLTYDLTGLPPTLAEIEEYEQDTAQEHEATRSLVNRLLASPRFGERWARYWMDIARYADNKGYVFQEDREYPQAFKYRDWLIDAFNSDMPYDNFILQQLAADRVAAADDSSNLPALGFLTLGRRFLNNKQDIIDDRMDVVTRGTMGMTLACARCHDHKYDPISQADYYSMFGIFLNTEEPGGDPWPHRLVDSEKMRPSFILIRGSNGNRGDKVPRRFVSFLDKSEQTFEDDSGRVELAGKITSPENPLTARVMANRIWMHLTGSSLVESPSDFGIRCPEPVQKQLLDHLALEFVDSGWSMKSLIRSIVLSDTYAQQSLKREQAASVDPENTLYWKMNRRRLDFEAMRDTMLAVSDQLEPTMHGKPERIDNASVSRRRTIYAYIDRQNLPSIFRTFDFAGPDSHSPQRAQTSVPQQGLYLLNSGLMASLATELGERTQTVAGTGENEARVRWLFEQVFAREPSREEAELAMKFLDTTPERVEPLIENRWIYGYGEYHPASGELRSFTPLPSFANDRWQGGKEMPDGDLGWCMLTASGGHPGNDLAHSVVKRWVAPRDGSVIVFGQLEHPSDQGDGVRGSALVNGELRETWSVANGKTKTHVPKVQIKAGDFVDVVTDCITGPAHDSFNWKFRIKYVDDPGESFATDQDMPRPVPNPLDRWAQLAQALLATNELVHID